MATLKERAGSRHMAADSLIGQVDHLVITPGDGCGDQAKFAACQYVPDDAVFLGVDDDLIYPPDYVEVTLRWLDEYPDAILSYHGWVADQDGKHAENYRCMEFLGGEAHVDVVGTGVCAFRLSTIRPHRDDFKLPNQADLWLALRAEREGIRRIVLPHPERWLGFTEWPHTIWHDTAYDMGGPLDAGESKRCALYELLPLLNERHERERPTED
jgi:hypothetical protein